MSEKTEYAADVDAALQAEVYHNYMHRVFLPIMYIKLIIRELAAEADKLHTKELSTFDPVLKEQYRVQQYQVFYRIAYLQAVLTHKQPVLDWTVAAAEEEVRRDNELRTDLKEEPENKEATTQTTASHSTNG